VRNGWSVRATERAVQRLAQPAARGKPPARKDPDVRRLETELSDRLGASVRIEHRSSGGRVVIRYHGIDELEGILDQLRLQPEGSRGRSAETGAQPP